MNGYLDHNPKDEYTRSLRRHCEALSPHKYASFFLSAPPHPSPSQCVNDVSSCHLYSPASSAPYSRVCFFNTHVPTTVAVSYERGYLDESHVYVRFDLAKVQKVANWIYTRKRPFSLHFTSKTNLSTDPEKNLARWRSEIENFSRKSLYTSCAAN